VWQGVTGAAALVLCFVPLLGLLGYELSLVLAVLASLGAGHVAAGYPARVRAQLAPYPGARWTVARLYFACCAYGLSLLAWPLCFAVANAARVRNCDIIEGLGFFVLMPAASVAVASAWGLSFGLATSSRRLSSIAWVAWWLGAIGVKLHEGWATPAIRAFGSFHGYFSGVLYDEAITLPFELLTFRARDALEVVTVLVACTWLIDRSELALRLSAARGRGRVGATVLALAVLVCLGFVAGPTLGHRRDAEDVAAALGGRTTRGRCVLIHPAWVAADDAQRLAADCAFRLHQVEGFFGIESEGELRVFLFSDPDEKQDLIGAGRTSIAKPWRREIYIHGIEFPHPAMKHEIAHVVAGDFGSGPLRISGKAGGILASPGRIEGAAMAAEWDEPELTAHQWSRAMHELDIAPPIDSILGLRFLGINASRAYVLAGSFSRFLIERHGAERFRDTYRTADLEAVYDRPIEQLEREWIDFLDDVPLREGDLDLARVRFAQPAIFDKVCAHEVAQLRDRARREEAAGAWTEALGMRIAIERFSDRDPISRLETARTLLGAGSAGRCTSHLKALLGDDRTAKSERFQARELLADIHWSRGERARALSMYRELQEEPSFESTRRMLAVKVAALETPRAEPHLRRFLIGGDRLDPEGSGTALLTLAELISELPDLAIGHYLLGRQLVMRGEDDRAVSYLERARRLGLPTDDLRIENDRILAIALFRLGRIDAARAAFAALASDPEISLANKVSASDWIERCEWEIGQRRVRE
jgi:tetratricopeptide (TPR) repeat protein